MIRIDRRRLMLIALLLGVAVLLAACSVDYFRLGKETGEFAREVLIRLKQFGKGFLAGAGGRFCAGPVPA